MSHQFIVRRAGQGTEPRNGSTDPSSTQVGAPPEGPEAHPVASLVGEVRSAQLAADLQVGSGAVEPLRVAVPDLEVGGLEDPWIERAPRRSPLGQQHLSRGCPWPTPTRGPRTDGPRRPLHLDQPTPPGRTGPSTSTVPEDHDTTQDDEDQDQRAGRPWPDQPRETTHGVDLRPHIEFDHGFAPIGDDEDANLRRLSRCIRDGGDLDIGGRPDREPLHERRFELERPSLDRRIDLEGEIRGEIPHVPERQGTKGSAQWDISKRQHSASVHVAEGGRLRWQDHEVKTPRELDGILYGRSIDPQAHRTDQWARTGPLRRLECQGQFHSLSRGDGRRWCRDLRSPPHGAIEQVDIEGHGRGPRVGEIHRGIAPRSQWADIDRLRCFDLQREHIADGDRGPILNEDGIIQSRLDAEVVARLPLGGGRHSHIDGQIGLGSRLEGDGERGEVAPILMDHLHHPEKIGGCETNGEVDRSVPLVLEMKSVEVCLTTS